MNLTVDRGVEITIGPDDLRFPDPRAAGERFVNDWQGRIGHAIRALRGITCESET